MSCGLVQYSDRIHSAQEQTREERIWEKVSSRRARMVGRSLGLVSMISRTKKTTSSAELLLVSPCMSPRQWLQLWLCIHGRCQENSVPQLEYFSSPDLLPTDCHA